MGAVKVDLSQKERALDAKYPALDSPENLRILLSDYHALLNRQYQGDYDAVVLLADLETAISMAKLTERQSEALRLVYEEDLKLKVAGELMGGIAKQNVHSYVNTAIEKIAEVYYYWSGHGEGYTTSEKGQTNGGL